MLMDELKSHIQATKKYVFDAMLDEIYKNACGKMDRDKIVSTEYMAIYLAGIEDACNVIRKFKEELT